MGLIATVTAVALGFPAAQPQEPAPAPGLLPLTAPPEIVLSAAADPVPLAAFGLGDGGLDATRQRAGLRWAEHGCTTPADIRVEVRAVGVKLTFPSGRELLVAPDGFLHLRDGSAAGPFEHGLELRLGDGAAVRVNLSPTQRRRLRDVVVLHGERALQPWRRGGPAREVARPSWWGGVRVCCCGDGGALYRAIALGPLVTLDRVLVPAARRAETPAERLVVLTAPLERALAELPRRRWSGDPPVRRAVRAVAATAQHKDSVFPDGAALRRVERGSLRWRLSPGHEIELALEGRRAPRLSLFAGRSARPMVEWAIGANSTAFLNNPGADQPGASRWMGNGVSMPVPVPELQARPVLAERARALAVIRRLL